MFSTLDCERMLRGGRLACYSSSGGGSERGVRLEATPTSPVDASIRRRFTLRNLGLVLPFVGYLFGEAALWGRLADLFTGLD